MGWVAAKGLDNASHGMQGSNTRWASTALIDTNFERTVMVVTNDGRTRMLMHTAKLANEILAPTS